MNSPPDPLSASQRGGFNTLIISKYLLFYEVYPLYTNVSMSPEDIFELIIKIVIVYKSVRSLACARDDRSFLWAGGRSGDPQQKVHLRY